MESNPNQVEGPLDTKPTFPGGVVWKSELFPFFLFLVFLFVQLFLALLPSWLDGTYYDYGLLVPILLPFFLYQRWLAEVSEPARALSRSREISTRPLTWIAAIAVLLLVGFLRLVESVDSGWRLPLYLHGGVVLGFSWWMLLRCIGLGAAIRFLPSAILVVIAIPLPSQVEHSLIDGLTEKVTDLAIFATRMLGIPVTHAGASLFVEGQTLHVSEGCSGIRSFQSSIFAGFVFGEFLRLNLFSRALLIAGSLLCAFLLNSLRVIVLVQYAASSGGENLDQVHDVSGYFSLGITFLAILGMGKGFEKVESAARAERKPRINTDSNE